MTFRNLTADEVECRIGQVSKSGKGLSLLLYKTARTDAKVLDEAVGPENWANDFKTIDGKMYCGIGIRSLAINPNSGRDEWVWKWDTGTESNMEAQKGEASDAFKRAGFKWGIGAALYDAPFIWVGASDCNINGTKCYDKFSVEKVAYDAAGRISGIAIRNDTLKKRVFVWTSN